MATPSYVTQTDRITKEQQIFAISHKDSEHVEETNEQTFISDFPVVDLRDERAESMASNALNEALWGACLDGDHEKVKQLIHQGANIHFKGQGGKTPLGIAAYCDNAEVVKILLNHGADPNEIDEFNRSTIHWLAMHGGYSTAVALIDHGADINIQTKMTRSTPLMIACTTGKMDIVKLLVSRGASWNVTNTEGLTPIQIARKEGHDQIEEYLGGLGLSSQEILTRNLQEGYVLLMIIKLILMGPPGVGKTSFKSLLFNWPPVLQYHSTGIASRPVQAIERMTEQKEGTIWEKVSAERLLSMVTAAMKVLATEPPIISEDIDHNALSHSNLVEDLSSSTQATTTVQVQPDLLFYSEKIIQEIEKGDVSGELYQSKWIYLLDSGGQPHFADVSRAFIRSNTVYTIAIKLTDKLSDKPPFLYSLEGKLLSKPNTDLCMTNLQLIKHFVRSIVSSESSKTGAKSLIFIIGTCSDLYYSKESKMESIAEKNKQLVAELKEFRDYIVFDNELDGKLIHPVNNICEGEEREKFSSKLRQKIVDQVNKMKVEIRVPIRWFVFEIMMKDEVSEKGIISLDKCSKISEKLHMKDLMECLEYLDSLSLILYFKCLPNVIFTDPQYLLDMLSNVISVSFISHSYLSPGVQHQLKMKGTFNNLLLDELKSLIFVPSLFEKHDFLTLLTDLCIVAPMNACTSQTDYFIPVVLPEKEKDREELKSDIVEPFLIKFDIGVVPQGVFLNMVVGLLNREHSPKFRIDPDVDQLRNAIELFSDDFSASIVLIEHFHWIEVYFYCNEEDKCHKFKVALGESISNCAKRLGYDSSKLKFVATVPCQLPHNKGPYSFHPVIVNEESGKINCSIEKRQCSKLSDRQIRYWFPSCMGEEYLSTSLKMLLDRQPVIKELITHVRTAEWNTLGVQLELDSVDLAGCTDLTSMYQLWIKEKAKMATRRSLLTALRSIRDNNVAWQYESYLRTLIY